MNTAARALGAVVLSLTLCGVASAAPAASSVPCIPSHAVQLLRQCEDNTAKGRYAAALPQCRRASNLPALYARVLEYARTTLEDAAGARCERRIRSGNWEGASSDCEVVYAIDPDSESNSIDRGEIELHKGWYADAWAEFDFIATVRDAADGYYWRGRTELAMKNDDQAISDFTRAIAKSYNVEAAQAPYYEYRARAYVSRGDRKAALADWKTATGIYANFGDCANFDRETRAGEKLLDSTFTLPGCSENPASVAARQCAAYAAKRALDQAISFCKMARKLDYAAEHPGVYRAQHDLGERLEARCDRRLLARDMRGALGDCEAAVDMNGESDTYMALARLELAMGRYADAAAHFDYAGQTVPTEPKGLLWAGYVYLRLKNYDAAYNSLSNLIDVLPSETAYEHRALAYLGQRDEKSALDDWRAAIRMAGLAGDCHTVKRLAHTAAGLFKTTTTFKE